MRTSTYAQKNRYYVRLAFTPDEVKALTHPDINGSPPKLAFSGKVTDGDFRVWFAKEGFGLRQTPGSNSGAREALIPAPLIGAPEQARAVDDVGIAIITEGGLPKARLSFGPGATAPLPAEMQGRSAGEQAAAGLRKRSEEEARAAAAAAATASVAGTPAEPQARPAFEHAPATDIRGGGPFNTPFEALKRTPGRDAAALAADMQQRSKDMLFKLAPGARAAAEEAKRDTAPPAPPAPPPAAAPPKPPAAPPAPAAASAPAVEAKSGPERSTAGLVREEPAREPAREPPRIIAQLVAGVREALRASDVKTSPDAVIADLREALDLVNAYMDGLNGNDIELLIEDNRVHAEQLVVTRRRL